MFNFSIIIARSVTDLRSKRQFLVDSEGFSAPLALIDDSLSDRSAHGTV